MTGEGAGGIIEFTYVQWVIFALGVTFAANAFSDFRKNHAVKALIGWIMSVLLLWVAQDATLIALNTLEAFISRVVESAQQTPGASVAPTQSP